MLMVGFSTPPSPVLRPVGGQKSALVSASATRSGSNLSTKTKFFAALSAGGCCMDVQRGAPNSELSTELLQGRRTARRNLALLVRRLHVLSYSQVPPRRILSRQFVVSSVKACVDRRVLSSQLLPLAYARSGSNLSTKPPFWQLCLLADAARTCREGPELRTLDQALRARRTAGRNLAILILRIHVLSYSRVPPRILSREFVVSSVKAFVDRRVLSSQLLPLAYARSGSNLSTKPPFWQLVCWRMLHGRAERAPNSELSTKLCEPGGQRDATWLFFYCVSSSQVPRK